MGDYSGATQFVGTAGTAPQSIASPLAVLKTTNPTPDTTNIALNIDDHAPAGVTGGSVVVIKGTGSTWSNYQLVRIYGADRTTVRTWVGNSGEILTDAWMGTHTYTADGGESCLSASKPFMAAFQSDIATGGAIVRFRDGASPTGTIWEACRSDTHARTAFLTSGGSLLVGSSGNTQVSAPAALTVATGAAGVLTGAYTYKVTFITADGETNGGTTSSTVSPSAQQVNLTAIPTGPAGTIARAIYRTLAGGTDGTQRWLTVIQDNTTTTFTDNTPDVPVAPGGGTAGGPQYLTGGLGHLVPTINTTGGGLFVRSNVSIGSPADSVDGFLKLVSSTTTNARFRFYGGASGATAQWEIANLANDGILHLRDLVNSIDSIYIIPASTPATATLGLRAMPKWDDSGLNTTGAGAAALGANCPASTVTAPYTWLKAKSSDGSAVYIPAWK